MKKKTLAKSSAELDRRFDSGEDIHDLIDLSKATVIHYGKRCVLHWILENRLSRTLIRFAKKMVWTEGL
jgi:hypothetical protein